jgi:hypothetical protein
MRLGYPGIHTNCQDILAEAIGEYGLTPDDVHDSLNFWMHSAWDDSGAYFPASLRNPGRAGDTVELLALMDVLAVANLCGSGDVSTTANYWFHPVRLVVRGATDETLRMTAELNAAHKRYANQRAPAQFKVKPREQDRACRKDPDYRAAFPHCPIAIREFELDLTEADLANVASLIRWGHGTDQEDAIRSAVMSWCLEQRSSFVASPRPR